MLTKSDLLEPAVLIADDDPSITRLCRMMLERAGFRVETASDGHDALERISSRDYVAILLDLQMPHMHGATVLSLLGRDKPEVLNKVIVMTALPEAALAGVRGGVASVLRKPLTDGEIVHQVRRCADPSVVPSEFGDRTARARV